MTKGQRLPLLTENSSETASQCGTKTIRLQSGRYKYNYIYIVARMSTELRKYENENSRTIYYMYFILFFITL